MSSFATTNQSKHHAVVDCSLSVIPPYDKLVKSQLRSREQIEAAIARINTKYDKVHVHRCDGTEGLFWVTKDAYAAREKQREDDAIQFTQNLVVCNCE